MIYLCNEQGDILEMFEHVTKWSRSNISYYENGMKQLACNTGAGEYFTDSIIPREEPNIYGRVEELEARSAEYDEYFADIIYEMSMTELGLEGGEI